MTDTILVLGATGKTGRRLVRQLLAKGANVRAASRNPGEGGTVFDWTRSETHGPALAGTKAIYLVDPAIVEDPTKLTGPFLDRARQAGVKKLVLLSSLGITFPNEDGQSGRHRLERQVMSSGLDWTVLRPSGFNQNFSESFLLPGILQADMVATATGNGSVGFVDADDIAAVAAAALTEDGHSDAIYPITGPEALSFAEATAIIGNAAGRTVTHRQISSDEYGAMLQAAGIPPDYVGDIVRNQEAIRDGHGAVVADTVRRVTGRAPVRFADFAAGAASVWAR